MIQAIVFSKKRPMQLEAFIRSYVKYAKDFYDELVVIYKDEPEFSKGYQRLKEIYVWVNWVRQDDFRRNVLDIIKDNGDFVSFFVDDQIFTGTISRDILKYFASDVMKISLRLGLNISYCYPMSEECRLSDYWENKDMIKWVTDGSCSDFGYKVSLDGDLFRTQEIKQRIGGLQFEDPNGLENELQHTHWIYPYTLSYRHGKVVNIPNNKVNEGNKNRSEGGDAVKLLHLFEAGNIIDFESMDMENISTHHPIPYAFKHELVFDLNRIPSIDGAMDQQTYRGYMDVPHGGYMLDVGGFHGELSEYAVDRFGCRSTIFEPIRQYADHCRDYFKERELINIEQLALGEQEKELVLYKGELYTSEFQKWTQKGESETVKMIRLSDWLKEPVDFLCINCEGGEYGIINNLIDSGIYKMVDSILLQTHPTKDISDYSKLFEKLMSEYTMTRGNVCWSIWKRK